jgi:hypothetical protein
MTLAVDAVPADVREQRPPPRGQVNESRCWVDQHYRKAAGRSAVPRD